MKRRITLFAFSLFLLTNAFSQNKFGDKVYSIGFGVGNENNVSNYGLFFSNDMKFFLSNRLSLNPRINFFQSLGSIENREQFGYRSHSGVFFDLGAGYSFFRGDSYDVTLNVGPSYQVGNETYSSSRSFVGGVLVDERFVTNQLRRIGAFCDLEFNFYIHNQIHSIGVKSNYFCIYPEFLGIVYKIGFKL